MCPIVGLHPSNATLCYVSPIARSVIHAKPVENEGK